MFTIRSPKISAESGSVTPVRMKLLSKIFTPRPMPRVTKPRIAFIKRKALAQRNQKTSGAARIAAEKRFVKGLGYIRADAIPCRSKKVKRASAGSVTDLKRVYAIMSKDVAYGEAGSAESSSSSRLGLYEVPKLPSTFSP